MKAKLLALLLPAGIMGLIFGVFAVLKRNELISQPTWNLLWPWLVALVFLALAAGMLYLRAIRWIWPFLVGFVAQSIGALLKLRIFGPAIETGLGVLILTLLAVGASLVVLFVVWVVAAIRARQLERHMLAGGGGDVDQQKLHELRQNMAETLALLRRAGAGRNAVYELPWFLVTGESQVGKTVAIKNSGLGLPVRRDRVKGVGGTHTCDWFFTNEMIFLDTPGSWTEKGADDQARKYWTELLRLVRRSRGRRPLDGLIVVVAADHLMTRNEDELRNRASHIREVIDLIHEELRFRFPVYVLVSKCDLIEGFVDFFDRLPPQRRHEILGWSNPDPNESDPARLISGGFRRVAKRLEAYRLEMLSRVGKVSQAQRLFFFPEEFKRLEEPLTAFTDELFRDDPSSEAPVFRGFYLTSGTQGEGSRMARAMSALAHRLGMRTTTQSEEGEKETRRSYFLLELFRTLIVGDDGLVSRTAIHWWRRRRDTVFVAFLPAGLAVLLLLLSLLSFFLNRGLYQRVADEVPGIVARLAEIRSDGLTKSNIGEALEQTELLRQFHRKLATDLALHRRLGMRQPGNLSEDVLQIFRHQLERTVLEPTLAQAEDFAVAAKTCTTSADLFYAVVWLRTDHLGESTGDLQALNNVWGLPTKDAEVNRTALHNQFSYLLRNIEHEDYLHGKFSLVKVARAVSDKCSSKGSMSSLAEYLRFEDDCAGPDSTTATRDCFQRLETAVRFAKEDSTRITEHMNNLHRDLKTLRSEPGAEEALEAIGSSNLSQSEIEPNDCVKTFDTNVASRLEAFFVDQAAMIRECKELAGQGPFVVRRKVDEQEGQLEEIKKDLTDRLEQYTDECGRKALGEEFTLHPERLFYVVKEYRRVECLGERDTPQRTAQQTAPVRGARPAVTTKPVQARRWTWLEAPALVERQYSPEEFEAKRLEWSGWNDYIPSMNPGEQVRERQRLSTDSSKYARAYAAAWMRYLESLRLTGREGAVSAWLHGLGESKELSEALEKAARAVPADLGTEHDELADLNEVREFVDDGKVEQYTAQLSKLGDALARCDEDISVSVRFRAQVASDDSANPLVAAKSWVQQHAVGLAGGRLRKLFLTPLEVAERDLENDDPFSKHWGEIAEVGGNLVRENYPFTNEESPLVTEKRLVALFGGQTGLIWQFQAVEGHALGDTTRAWLDRATQLSRLFYKEDKDELRDLKVTVTILEPTFDPPKLKDDWVLQRVWFELADEQRLEWKPGGEPGEKTMKTLTAKLFGEEASKRAEVGCALAEKKALGKLPGVSSVKKSDTKTVPHSGVWAPVKLIAAGLGSGAPAMDGTTLTLSYSVPILDKPDKKDLPGNLMISVKVEPSEVVELVKLTQTGLAPPPADPSE